MGLHISVDLGNRVRTEHTQCYGKAHRTTSRMGNSSSQSYTGRSAVEFGREAAGRRRGMRNWSRGLDMGSRS